MRTRSILLGAVGAVALAGLAQAQVIGGGVTGGVTGPVGGVAGSATGRITGPGLPMGHATDAAREGIDTTKRTAKRAKAKAETTVDRTGDRARGAVDSATDASARASGSAAFAAGTTVRDSSGAEIGQVVGTDASGAVSVRTRSGLVSVPSASLRMSGGAAVSSQSEAQLRASGSVRAN